MDCLNCGNRLAENDEYCSECGAIVVKDRLTAKGIWKDLTKDTFGWDNRYLRTVRTLVVRPEKLLKEYLSGVRKRYTPPFVFFTIGTAMALLVFNVFAEHYIALSNEISVEQIELMEKYLSPETAGSKDSDFAKEQMELNEKVQRFMIRYFNLLSVLILPAYALMSFWTFRKQHNYGEHLVINAYLQGQLFILTTLSFIFSVLFDPKLYYFVLIISFFYYCYVFKRFYGLDLGGLLLKILRFFAVFIITSLIMGIGLMMVGLVVALVAAWGQR